MTLAERLSVALQRQWWRPEPTWLCQMLRPVAWLAQMLARWHRRRTVAPEGAARVLPVPVVVVGNLIVGGAGKTPTVMALLRALQAMGWRPGVVSRGHGRTSQTLVHVRDTLPASDCGDEPLLIHRRSQVPVTVARDRLAAAQALLAAHPEVNLLVADDGLQHWRLPRDLQVLVFDARGVGNGLTLPAGPLRQPFGSQVPRHSLVLYNADAPSTPWPGATARRILAGAVPLADWWAGHSPSLDVLHQLAQRSAASPVHAVAGLGHPERFFGMLEAAGLRIVRQALPDHADLSVLPWPAGTADVVLTEKDAVKLRADAVGSSRVWVVALDFQLPPDFLTDLAAALPPPP